MIYGKQNVSVHVRVDRNIKYADSICETVYEWKRINEKYFSPCFLVIQREYEM